MSPLKPYPDYPLGPHKNGQWCKKIKGKIRYFGPLADPDAALVLYQSEKAAWEAGVNPRTTPLVVVHSAVEGLQLADGLNIFLERFDRRVIQGDVSRRSYNDNKGSAQILLSAIPRYFVIDSMTAQHWQVVEDVVKLKGNTTTCGNHINRIKGMMKWLTENQYIKPPRYGTAMKMPSKASKRKARAEAGKQWFDRDEITTLLKHAKPSLKAMILLGVNCGYGNADCSRLQTQWIDFDTGWVQFARPKTGVDRRAKLWPKTIEAINAWIEVRPKFSVPNLFVTKFGNPWSDEDSSDCEVAKQFRKLCKDVSLHESGRGFYGFRRTCETIGSEAMDQIALDYIMGHIDQSMAAVYRQRISDDRVAAVCEYVRNWLFKA